MKRFVAFGFVAVLMVSAPGCGGGADSLIKESISDMNDLSAALEKKESPEKIKAAAAKLKATTEKLKDLKLPKEEEEKLQKKYETDVKAAAERMMKAGLGNIEGAKAMAEGMK
jgi:hypothetical protein